MPKLQVSASTGGLVKMQAPGPYASFPVHRDWDVASKLAFLVSSQEMLT